MSAGPMPAAIALDLPAPESARVSRERKAADERLEEWARHRASDAWSRRVDETASVVVLMPAELQRVCIVYYCRSDLTFAQKARACGISVSKLRYKIEVVQWYVHAALKVDDGAG